jgi:dihydrolipoamide dehydrogenase
VRARAADKDDTMSVDAVDFLVIGAGPGGYAAALHAAHLGRQVVLVDRRGEQGLGGVCLHEGCVPTKALLRLAGEAGRIEGMRAAGLQAGDISVDLAVFQEWKRGLITRLSDGVRRLLATAGVQVVAGTSRFAGPTTAEIVHDGAVRAVTFTDAVIATGSRPLAPDNLPIDGRAVLDSTGALDLTKIPPSLLVVGGGSVGMELGTTFAKLGSVVTIVERAEQLMPMFDPVLVRPLQRRLAQLGVEVVVGAEVADLDSGKALVRTAKGEQRIEAAVVLAGVGRRPNTDTLGLELAGVAVDDRGFTAPDPDLRVSAHIAAVGDVTPGPFHAHKASAQAKVAAQALCGRHTAFDRRHVPIIVHSEPELASVGITPAAASAPGSGLRLATFPLGGSGWAVATDTAIGAAHVVVDDANDTVVGVHLVGPHATELIAEGALAVDAGARVEDLSRTIHAHPTLSEQLGEAAHVATGLPVHVAPRAARPRRV